jgi:predicted amidophosphoribosyltransferase
VTIFPDESRSLRASAERATFPALPFASCFAYLPGGCGPVSEDGRLLCSRLKSADRDWLARLIAQVWLETRGHGRFARTFGGRVVLIPVPGSAPAPGARCVAERVAGCLREVGLAADVWPVLQRRYAVRKSAFAAAGERPSVLEHYASFAAGHASWRGGLRLTLVDDVITRGRTLLAAAARIREAFPAAEVCAFALLRTLAPSETLRGVLDPCEGDVRWVLGDARRSP